MKRCNQNALAHKRQEIAMYEEYSKAASQRKEYDVKSYYDNKLQKLRSEYLLLQRLYKQDVK